MNVIFTCGGTGGHINPAIAVANIWKNRYPDSRILFIGAEGGLEEQLVPKAGYELVLLPGDLLDGAHSAGTLENLKEALREMAVPVFITPGNHDPYTPSSPYARLTWPSHVHIFTSPYPERVELLACLIYSEAGGDACSDLCRFMVGDVVLNRVADSRFPDTIEEVLTQRGQYGTFSKTGVVWPARASNPGEAAAVERAYDTARRLLSGEHSELYDAGYVWQAEFIQGKDVIEVDCTYFGR